MTGSLLLGQSELDVGAFNLEADMASSLASSANEKTFALNSFFMQLISK